MKGIKDMNAIRGLIIWYGTKRLAAAHPFFGRKGGLLSRREAKSILQGRKIPNGTEVMRQARNKLGIPAPVPEKTAHSFARKLSPFSLRRGVVYLSALLIVFGFFTMTEAGAALAKGIYNVIVSVFDGSLLSRNESTTDHVIPIDFAALPAELESLEAVAEATGRQIVIPGGSEDVLVSFSAHMVGDETLIIRSRYNRINGNQYVIVQSLYNDSAFWSGANSTTEDSINTIELAIGIKAYLSTMEDGTVYAEAFDMGHDLNISSTMLSVEELKEVIMNLKYVD